MDFYGDNIRWFVGRVLNANDPEGRGRVQIRIHGVHSDRPEDYSVSDYPWAEVMLPSTEGGVSGIGKIPQIVESAFCFGIFMDGKESQAPLVLGSLSHNEHPSATQQRRMQELSRNLASYGSGNTRTDGLIDTQPSLGLSTGGIGPDGIVTPDNLVIAYDNVKDDTSTQGLNAKRLIIMLFLMSQKGKDGNPMFSDRNQAAGIVGNLEGENSTFDPGEPSSYVDANGRREPSFGLAQWNSDAGRFQKLQRFARRIRTSEFDFFTQLKFLLHELNGVEINGDGGSSFNNVYNHLRRCTKISGGPYIEWSNSGTNATWVFLDKYEIPRDKQTKIRVREEYAQKALDVYDSHLASGAMRSS